MKFSGNTITRGLRTFFGIFMLFVYIGMSILMFINFFNWSNSLTWFRYLLGVVFFLYGLYRCYRQYKGLDYYHGRVDEEDDEGENQNSNNIIKK